MKQPDDSDTGREEYAATYCPEDNKLRLYTGRVERSTFEWLRALGFTSTPKQDCDFVATWSPQREDAALLMIAEGDDIGDEDQTPEDRAADRAERFSGYREKRRAEAGGLADRYDAGPDAYGSQNAGRAERQAARRDRTGARACTQWGKAEYWQHRTAGVISHALHQSSAPVRRSRILRLEAEQRKHLADIEEAQKAFDAWQRVFSLEGLGEALQFDEEGRAAVPTSPALRLAYHLANTCGGWYDHKHPRTGKESSLYSHLFSATDPITAREAATLAIGDRTRPEPGRWAAHYELRLAYERQMLEAEGGSAGSVEMQPGGTLGPYLITKVNKSAATGAVVSVNVHVPKSENEGYDYRRRSGETMLLNVQRMGEHVYNPPTEESMGRLAEWRREQKTATQKANAGKPQLVNPTPEDAERLQAAINEREARRDRYMKPEPKPVLYMTQAEYTSQSQGTYACLGTYYLRAGAVLDNTNRDLYSSEMNKRPIVCKVRASYSSVVVITDKPQKPLPDWSERNQEVKA
jgi:hypothetical protein